MDNSRESQLKYIMKDELIEVEKYILLKNKIYSYFNGDILISNVSLNEIEDIYFQLANLKDFYKISLIPIIEEMEKQKNKINLLFTLVNNMYETNEKLNIRENLSRLEYNQTLEIYKELKQEDIKKEYFKYLDQVDKYLLYKEKLEAEKERQLQIIIL